MLEGALKIKGVLKVIISTHGAAVSGEFYRIGRQYYRADVQGDCGC
jgi:hypothetical protein